MITAKDISPSLFISMYANFLKKSGRIEIPSWLNIVKTGTHKSNAPYNSNWFFYRLASLARKFYFNRCKGIETLKKKYGGKKRNGASPSRKVKSSGKILRAALQELEKLKIISKNAKGIRVITKKAKLDMDIRAGKIFSIKK
ncbi:40S ribosomal protein S19 (nucleomorph) [Chroomonas mesostigmatica CCMP1168]|uniref:40S ribosomal protein S19 n=1 Tax=Chroomonas mesostigmatica CCMP1168 TaxID=1195612 RepID=J7G210_9CRYP|nr:40S ribosomal protein S19 [Chroomonas mesostigmatica CCMP1168]